MGGISAGSPPGTWLLVSQPSELPPPASPSSQLSSLGEPPPSLVSHAGCASAPDSLPGTPPLGEDSAPDSSLGLPDSEPGGDSPLGEPGGLDELGGDPEGPGGLGGVLLGVEGGELDGLGKPLDGDGILGIDDCGPGGGVIGAMHADSCSIQPMTIRFFNADMRSPSISPEG